MTGKIQSSKGQMTRQLIRTFGVAFFLIFTSPSVLPAQDGKTIFKQKCAVCHTIGKGDLVGPDLAGITEKREADWLRKFINSSQSLINSGDQQAVEVYNKYNETVMPDQNLSDSEMDAVLNYIKAESPEEKKVVQEDTQPAEQPAEPSITLEEASESDVQEGRKLFSGMIRFRNGGASCLSCHNVRDDQLVGGGLLARDLTQIYDRMNDNAVKAMIQNPPFPAMKVAYKNRELTEEEIFKLRAFLSEANRERYYQVPTDYQGRFLYTGLTGLVTLLLVFTGLWWGRKKKSVNQEIYDRQIKSSN